MATNPLTYSIQDDFGGSFSSVNFSTDIQDPANGVERSLSHINTTGDVINVYFVGSSDIAQADVDIIQGASYPSPIGGLIASHDPTPQDAAPIAVYQSFSEDPHRARLDGVLISVGASQWGKADYALPENLHLNEAHVQWSGCFAGDYGYTCLIHPDSEGSLAQAASAGANKVDVGAKVSYFSPSVGAEAIELWNSEETQLLEVHKIYSTSGTEVFFNGTTLAADRNTSVKMKARFGSFSPMRGASNLLGGLQFFPSSGLFSLRQTYAVTSILSAGLKLSSRVCTTADAGTRVVTVNFLLRVPAS